MSRYTGPIYRKSRRFGFSVLETGEELVKRPTIPGQHGAKRGKKLSNYGIQLKEKQKVRFMYGMSEKQFKRTFEKARKMHGVLGDNFLKLLEARLDNVAYRLGLAQTRRASRQVVNHGHIAVNGKKVDIPSYQVKPGDVISVRENSKSHPALLASVEKTTSRVEFVTYDAAKMEGTFVRYPERNELNKEIDIALVVEFYNK